MHHMHRTRIGIFGASGYAGTELIRLAAGHPELTLGFAASERHVGVSLEDFTGVPGELAFVDFAAAREAARSCDAVFLATPAEVSLSLVPELSAAGVKVVDLSGGYRLQDTESSRQHYGEAASAGALRTSAVYGLPELFREQVRGASILSNPGCYPTAAALALAPLLAKGAIRTDDLVVSALSGASGAGRKGTEEYSLVELHDDVRAYKVLGHQHQPEIAQTLARVAGAPVDLTFTPHLLPVPRGILSTAYARLHGTSDSRALTALFREAYRDEPFIRVVERPEDVSLHKVVGTNLCLVGVACDARGHVVVISAIDNLVKGAAGQAVQNLNLMLGFDESAGLASLRRFH